MTSPTSTPIQPQPAEPKAPVVTQTHSWIYVGLASLSTIFSIFSPKIAAYSGAHPTGTLVVAGLASVIGSFLPSAVGAGQQSPPTPGP